LSFESETIIVSPLIIFESIISSEIGSSNNRCMALLRGLTPFLGSYPWSAIKTLALRLILAV